MDKKENKVIHSPEIKISVFSNPNIVVRNMIKRYKEFMKV